MWKQEVPRNLLTRVVLTLVLTAHFLDNTLALSDKRLCADINCKEIISMGTGVISYRAGDEGMVSFKINSLIRIKSKSAGSNPSLWGIEVNGREGYAPKEYIRETKILISEKDLKFVVDVKPGREEPILTTSEKSEQVNKMETTTTPPLNHAPTDNPLKHSSNETFTAENAPVATPASSEMDGAEILYISNNSDGIVENINEKVDSLTNIETKQEIYKDETANYVEDYDDAQRVENSQKEELVSESKTKNVLGSIEQIKGFARDVPDVSDEDIVYIENNDENQQPTNSKEVPTVSDSKTNNVLKSSEEIKNLHQDVHNSLKNEINDGGDKNESPASHSKVNNFLKPREEKKGGTQDSQDDLKEQISNKGIYDLQDYTRDVQDDLKKEINNNDKDQLQEDTQDVQDDLKEKYNNKDEDELQEYRKSQNKSIESNSKSNNVLKTSEDLVGVSQVLNDKPKQMQQDDVQEHTKVKENSENTNEAKEENSKAEVMKNLSEETNSEDIHNKERHITEKNQVNIEVDENKVPSVGIQNGKRVSEKEENLKDSLENSGQISVGNYEGITTVNGDIYHKYIKNDKDVIKQYSFNLTENSNNNEDSSKIAKQHDLSQNNENLVITVTEPITNANLKDKETSSDQTNIENHSQQLIKENEATPIKIMNTESYSSSKPDKVETTSDNTLHNKNSILNAIPKIQEEELSAKINDQRDLRETETNSKETSSENPQRTSNEIKENNTILNATPKIPEEELSEKINDQKDIRETETNSKETFSENPQRTSNEIKENNTINIESLDSANTNMDSILERTIYNSNSDTSNNLIQEAQAEEEMDNKNSFLTETTYLSQPKSNMIKEPINKDENVKFASESLEPTEETILSTTPKTPEGVLGQATISVENNNPTTYSNDGDIFLNTPTSNKYDNTYQSSSKNIPPNEDSEKYSKENKGLFATIMSTVNNMLPINKKNKQYEYNGDNELNGILFSKNQNGQINEENNLRYCQNIGPNGDCPETEIDNHEYSTAHLHHTSPQTTSLTLDTFLKTLASKMLEISELLAFLIIAAAAALFFVFGYYCFCNSSREGALLLKLNQLESSLLASHKENAILKHNLMSTRQKLASIEDNSFGSNDMVVSLKKELEEELMEKARLQEQNTVLQKELENAADAGIELNKIVSELLSNQTGDESIISSVEELQKQLNEQQNTILEINASLAEKSRENSELQLLIAEQNARYQTELANLQRDNDELEHEKGNLITKLDELKNEFDKDITAALEGKNFDIKRLQNEIMDLTHKVENEHTKWQTSVAKIEALEECLKNVRRDPHVNITEVIDIAYVKAQLIETQKKYKSLKEKLETELDSKKLTENQLEMVCAEVEKLKQDFNQSEKDKLEAQTRLEVLSNYFKDKENQLQKELSLKEAMWLQQQGETSTTVDRVTAMKEEIQSLKSQNDSLRAEIEAQVAAHKAQIGTLENRAHETWLAARQSDRRYEEARAEATALRRKLTAVAGGNINEVNNKSVTGPAGLGDEMPQAPSPIHMESPGSPMLGRMPPPPFLPPPFMGPPPPFMGMPPPPPFVPTGEMRPAPLGRIMSPPPQRSGRFSPQQLDYEDYLDYESNNSWHRHTYSPPPRTYRSLSPTDSRYNYGTEHDLMSTYDTETDFSPPPSPRESRRRGGNSSERTDSKTKITYDNSTKFNTSKKGPLSSGSEKSFNTPLHNETKIKKGNASLGGKSLV